MNKNLTNPEGAKQSVHAEMTKHVASILNLSEEDASQWIDDNKVIRKYIKSSETCVIRTLKEEVKNDNTEMVEADISDDNVARKRSIFTIDGEPVRLETVFILWFERTGNQKKKETIERYLKGETLSRKDLKGYLKSASSSMEDLDTFILLFNLLIEDKELSLSNGKDRFKEKL